MDYSDRFEACNPNVQRKIIFLCFWRWAFHVWLGWKIYDGEDTIFKVLSVDRFVYTHLWERLSFSLSVPVFRLVLCSDEFSQKISLERWSSDSVFINAKW